MKKLSKLNKKLFIILVLIVAIFSICIPTVNADTSPRIPGDHQLKNGIGNFNYYITDSVLNYSRGSTLVSLIDKAVNSWEVTGYGWNPLYAHRTYDYYSSNMDIYMSERAAEGYTMGTIFYFTGSSPNATEVNPQFSNWSFTEVTLFVSMYNWNDTNKIQRYIANFFGQTFGLAQNTDKKSVMCNFYTDCYVYLPSQADHNGLNAIYNK